MSEAPDLIGTVWVGGVSTNGGGGRVLWEVVDVREWWNGSRSVPMVYGRRLDDQSASQPPGTVHRVSWVGAFVRSHRRVTREGRLTEPARTPEQEHGIEEARQRALKEPPRPKATWTGRYDGQLVDCRRCGAERTQRAKTGSSSWAKVCNDCYRLYMHNYNHGSLA